MEIEIEGVLGHHETNRLLHEILQVLRRIEKELEPPKAKSAKLVIKEN